MGNYMNYKEYFQRFVGGWTFANGDMTVTIKEIKEEKMYDSKTCEQIEKPCVYFEELDLPMVLNKTKGEAISEVVGSENVYDWIGKKIMLGSSREKIGGKYYDVVAVRNVVPDDTTYICEECGAVIKPTKSKQPSELAEISRRNTGKVMCVACMKKYKEENDAE